MVATPHSDGKFHAVGFMWPYPPTPSIWNSETWGRGEMEGRLQCGKKKTSRQHKRTNAEGANSKREGRQAAAGKARLTLNRTTAATSERGAIVE